MNIYPAANQNNMDNMDMTNNMGFMNNMAGNIPFQASKPVQGGNIPCMPMPELAKAYIPFQNLYQVYPPIQGLERGTIFPELDKPYGVDPEYTVDA